MALLDFAPEQIRPTALALNLLVGGIGLFRWWRGGFVRWRNVLPFVLASAPAAFLSAQIKLPHESYSLLLGLVLLVAAIGVFRHAARAEQEDAETAGRRVPWLPGLLVGAAIGVLSGLTGTWRRDLPDTAAAVRTLDADAGSQRHLGRIRLDQLAHRTGRTAACYGHAAVDAAAMAGRGRDRCAARQPAWIALAAGQGIALRARRGVAGGGSEVAFRVAHRAGSSWRGLPETAAPPCDAHNHIAVCS
jgi:hypothetical protein